MWIVETGSGASNNIFGPFKTVSDAAKWAARELSDITPFVIRKLRAP